MKKPFQKGSPLKRQNLLLLLRVNPIEKGGKNEIGRVALPEIVTIHVKNFIRQNRHNLNFGDTESIIEKVEVSEYLT